MLIREIKQTYFSKAISAFRKKTGEIINQARPTENFYFSVGLAAFTKNQRKLIFFFLAVF